MTSFANIKRVEDLKYVSSFYLYIALFFSLNLLSQTITPQKFVFSKICAGRNFNEFEAVFNHTGFPPATKFEVELSDNFGNFATPIKASTLKITDETLNQKRIMFSIPEGIISSENYKIRVKSATGFVSSPFLNSNSSNSFPIYFKSYENSFFINNKESNINVCNGKTINLTIYNQTPSFTNSSPANFPLLKYKWYKDSVLINGENSSSLNVSNSGIYYAELDYGICSDSNYSSNRVTVTNSTAVNATISSSLGNPYCGANNSKTVLSTDKGSSYQWYKDNVLLEGAINPTYETNQEGNFSVSVNFEGCESKPSIDLKKLWIKGVLDKSSPIMIDQGDSKSINVSYTPSTITNPKFSWYRNGIEIPNTSASYDVISDGIYKVNIAHLSCSISDELVFEVKFTPIISINEIPNLITPNDDSINDTWSIPVQYTSGNDVEVLIVSSNGELMLKTKEYTNNWPEKATDINPNFSVFYYVITPPNENIKRGTITVLK